MFGLKLAVLNGNGRVNPVACRFCISFGRETHDRTTKIVAVPSRTKYSIRSRLNFPKKIQEQQKTNWSEYNQLEDREKINYFNVNIDYDEQIKSFLVSEDVRVYKVSYSIVNNIMQQLLLGGESSEAMESIIEMGDDNNNKTNI